jgi:Leucine-rich repeat (LRR) protein
MQKHPGIIILILWIFIPHLSTAQIITIPDSNFKAALMNIGVDLDMDGEIQQSEAELIDSLKLSNDSISSLTGIKFFTNLVYLDCSENLIIDLDLAGMSKLKELNCSNNNLITINVSNLISLIKFNCSLNDLQTLHLKNLNNLEFLNCGNNSIKFIDYITDVPNLIQLYCVGNELNDISVNHLTKLNELDCGSNKLNQLNIDNLINLETLCFSFNLIETIDLTTLKNLKHLFCSNNQLKYLDVSNLSKITNVLCDKNQIKILIAKTGSKKDQFQFLYNPLEYICCDNFDLNYVEWIIKTYNFPNCSVNSYCSFTPGGSYYEIQGQNRVDGNSNGCDLIDPSVPFLKFIITDGKNSGSYIADISGNYSIPVQTGTHTLKPLLEIPSFFSVTPDTLKVNFPNNPSPYFQDFCLSPMGLHPDLEIKIIPLTSARPGFDAQYKLVYHNKGNTRLSGQIYFDYNEDLMDLVNSNTTPLNQNPGSLIWKYTDLDPFQTAGIIITMKINTPSQNPPVHVGDALNFSASIEPIANDELPLDNLFTLHQTVVGSIDPNDKTCLQGNSITPSMVGSYVDYLIRFENTGIAEAIHVVVKDIIDTSKFDISSLIPIESSHLFRTIISEGNKVEFIFQNINLPFSGDGRSGYIAFKIRTKSSLSIGDSLKNSATIYFDYNLPISTNQTETIINQIIKTEEESNVNFEISVSPNPTCQFIYIRCSKRIIQLEILDSDSRLLETLITPEEKIDVGQLKTGLYWIVVHTESGNTVKKFVKY